MRCQFCDGLGTRGKGWYERDMEPCPECGGTGHLHCCEGLREQPETEKDCEDEHR